MRGFPPSRVRSRESAARLARISPAVSWSILPRSIAGNRRQWRCAAAAAADARRTSSTPASATSSTSSSVAGSMILRGSAPPVDGVQPPSIQSSCTPRVYHNYARD